jgi:hypothetical protein
MLNRSVPVNIGDTLPNDRTPNDEHQALVTAAHRAATVLVAAGAGRGTYAAAEPWPAELTEDDITDCRQCGRQIYGPGLCQGCQSL